MPGMLRVLRHQHPPKCTSGRFRLPDLGGTVYIKVRKLTIIRAGDKEVASASTLLECFSSLRCDVLRFAEAEIPFNNP